MIAADEALRLVLDNAPLLGAEDAALDACVGRTLAEDLRAREDLPPFDNSAMDGFAVRSADCRGAAEDRPAVLEIRETVRAGASRRPSLRRGGAIRIMTGAPLPPGADAVVMKEYSRPTAPGRVALLHAPAPGEHVRRRGEDVKAGAPLLSEGTALRPYEVALLAAQGLVRVPVVRRPRVAVLATGDELVEPERTPGAGGLRDSNGPALSAALSRWGASILYKGIVRDDPAALRAALAGPADDCNALVLAGGVSAGDFDFTKRVLEERGLRTIFWKVAIKPGKPLLFGVLAGRPVFGLPGNPVAALVCLEEFVRPALEKMQGRVPGRPNFHLQGTAVNHYPAPGDRQQYLFCRAKPLADGYRLEIIRPQGSAMMATACRADALAVRPAGLGRVQPGDVLSFRWLK